MVEFSFDMSGPPSDFPEKAKYQFRSESSSSTVCADQGMREHQFQSESPLPSVPNRLTSSGTYCFPRDLHKCSREFWLIGLATSSIHLVLSKLDIGWKTISLIEMAFFGLNFGMFFLNSLMFLSLLIGSPSRTWEAINDPHKSLSISLMVTQMATLILGCLAYCVPGGWIDVKGAILIFYIYLYFSICVTLFSWAIWFRKPHELKKITPEIILMIIPLLFVGALAVDLLEIIPLKSELALQLMLIGYLSQGMSSVMAGAYLTVYLQRLAVTGHISGAHSSVVFIAVLPPGLTAHVLVKLGRLAPMTFLESANEFLTEGLGEAFQGFGMLAGLMLTGASLLIYAKSVIAFWWKGNRFLEDILGIWILIFPNVGLILALKSLLELFGTPWFFFMQLFLSGVLITTYVMLVPLTLFGILRKRRLDLRQPDVASRPRYDSHIDQLESSRLGTPWLLLSSQKATDGNTEAYQMDTFSTPSRSRSDSAGAKTLVEHAA